MSKFHAMVVICILLGSQTAQSNISDKTIQRSNQQLDSFKLLWLQEGEGCQNWANDTANNGGKSYTCNGITQSVWSDAIASKLVPSDLPVDVKAAYNQNSKQFKKYAETIYKTNYLPPCKHLGQLTKTVCLSQSVNFGVSAITNRLKQLNTTLPDKEQAKQLIELGWQRYQAICNSDPSQRPFCEGGWKQNILNQTKYINGTL